MREHVPNLTADVTIVCVVHSLGVLKYAFLSAEILKLLTMVISLNHQSSVVRMYYRQVSAFCLSFLIDKIYVGYVLIPLDQLRFGQSASIDSSLFLLSQLI